MHQSMKWKGTVILNNVFVPARCLLKVFWLDQDAKQDMHIIYHRGKGKGNGLGTCCSAAYMSRLKTSCALQSRKWQLIGMS